MAVTPWPEGMPPANPTQPRIDTVVKRGDQTRVLAGTPTVGATLANRLGCAPIPEGWEAADHYILVSPGATTITEADVAPNLWTPALNDDVERIESEISRRTG